MLAEAVARLLFCRRQGSTHDEMANCFEPWISQIAKHFDWDASRSHCIDGSHLFAGEYGDAFAILPDCRIAFGIFGHYPNALVDPRNYLQLVGGVVWLEAPNLRHASKIL